MAQAKKQQKEIRTIATKIELRSVGEGDNQQEAIEGYALKFNKWSDTLGFWVPFREKIMPGALDECDMSNIVATFNHDQNMPLARNTIKSDIGSLELSIDGIGLHFRCIPTNTSYANDLKENIRSNVVNQCSFAFEIDYDDEAAEDIEFNEDDNIYERTINKIKTLHDVSVVTTPAYPDTEAVVSQRCKDKIKELRIKQKRSNVPDEEDEHECACESCNHSDNCQSSGAKCCICCNCSMASECSKPGADGCKCNVCSMAENNCCQPNSDNCLCSTCQNTDCKKGHLDNASGNNSNSMNGMQMNSKGTKDAEFRKRLISITYL